MVVGIGVTDRVELRNWIRGRGLGCNLERGHQHATEVLRIDAELRQRLLLAEEKRKLGKREGAVVMRGALHALGYKGKAHVGTCGEQRYNLMLGDAI